ncbi:MAG: branched-chain amino acid aminotransferase [Clostridiales Family XIII bacterium]|jgi:branched-chain amino acid aminotransferase|nr:branched-chain amino acid aminotransferase [Clostridiales Family XIII bacterium]
MRDKFPIMKTYEPKQKPDPDNLEFGTVFTDHMFLMDYDEAAGWYDGRIVPYSPLRLDPAAAVLHYSQEIFEGLKTYKAPDGGLRLFRPDMNAKRMNRSAARVCMPAIDEGLFVDAIKTLVSLEADWVPDKPGTSLYIRPFMIATEPFLGVRPSKQYIFSIILCPVGPYYKGGIAPTKIFVEDEYVRSVVGGTGTAKVGGNYAASLKSQVKAHSLGFSQVLWLDGVERRYVEEIGTSNAFFVIGGEVFTAPLGGSILPGITRDTAITLLKDWGITVREERFTIDEVYKAFDDGKLSEVFATGTATVISPVGHMRWKDKEIVINGAEIGELSQRLYDGITDIQTGAAADKFGWTVGI